MSYLSLFGNLSFRKISVSLFAALLLLGCATPHHYEPHTFQFHIYHDNQDTEILDYWYGQNATEPMVGVSKWRREHGVPKQGESIFGLTERGDYLYVKWRNNTTKKIYDDKVDLRFRLPKDIAMSTVYFMVKEGQLKIYVVSDASKRPNEISIGPYLFRDRKVTMIYPD